MKGTGVNGRETGVMVSCEGSSYIMGSTKCGKKGEMSFLPLHTGVGVYCLPWHSDDFFSELEFYKKEK